MIKRFLSAVTLAAGLLLLGNAANAVIIINPTTGGSGDFFFSGGVITPPDDQLVVTVTGKHVIDVFLDDCCIVGDEFALLLDGSLLTPTASNPGAGSLFFADYIGVVLQQAGTFTFTITQTRDCCGAGQGFFEVSAAREAPEPGTLGILALGLAGLGLIARRRRKAA